MKTDPSRLRQNAVSWLTLFAATGTLVCCALPILFVTLGLGAAVAAVTSAVPFLVALALHKAWAFAGSGLMLLASGWLLYRPGRACPSDPELARLCERAHRWNRRIHGVSAALWGVGLFAAYLALPIRIWLGV
jgi:mercuric ion transport protein